jgi:hypothetical protein
MAPGSDGDRGSSLNSQRVDSVIVRREAVRRPITAAWRNSVMDAVFA